MISLIFAAALATLPLSPNPALTPGWANPAIRQDNIQQTICVRGYTAGDDSEGNSVRAVTAATKRHIMQEYGVSRKDGPIEIDHRVPLEVGGANDPRNLWPETRQRIAYSAWDKDKLETHIHAEVCKGNLTLQQGQAIFLGDWKPAFDKYFGADEAGK